MASTFKILFSFIRPFAPRLIPLLVFSFFIPLIVTCSISAGWVVWSSLSLDWEVPLYLQYGDGVSPYAYTALPKLNPHQRHDILVDVLVPFTSSNLLLGNFMTSLTLSTSNNITLAHVRRPAIALPTPSFFPLKPKSAHIKIPMLESFEAGSSNLFARVEIGRHDGWKMLGAGEGRELSVISTSLRGLIIPHGIRGLATRFPLLASIASAFIFLLILSLIIGLCLVPMVLKTTTYGTKDEAGVNETLFFPKTTESRRRRRSGSGRESTERTSVKKDTPVQEIPSVENPTKPRRRPSKPAVGTSETEI